MLVDVIYDDGSLQDWVGQDYGDGVVVVRSMLTDSLAHRTGLVQQDLRRPWARGSG